MLNSYFIFIFLLCSTCLASNRKGFGLCHYKCGDTFALTNARWWYNWHYKFDNDIADKCEHRANINDYVPMIWGEQFIHEAVIPENSTVVLGFNEPNEPHQSNISPERCAELWPQIEKIAGNRTLVSPALAGCDINPISCVEWFERFFNACTGCRVDKIAVHAYHCMPYNLIRALGKISSHFNRPIWLTEFACHGNVSVEDQINFINVALPFLEAASFVEKYAWFCTRRNAVTPFMPSNSSDLLNLDGPSLSQVGTVYNNIL